MFGGHLGTTLLEMGFLDEDSLGGTLSRIFGVPYADFEMLSKVPYSIVRSLPAKLAEKHKVVPLRLDGRLLRLAMIDPKNLLALDEISFVTGLHIEPWVAPEINVLQALEFYYNVRRSERYVTLARELSRRRARRERRGEIAIQAAPDHAGSSPARAVEVAVGAPAAGHDAMPDHGEKYGYGRSWREFADALEGDAPRETSDEEADTRPQKRVAAATLAPAPRRSGPARQPGAQSPTLMESARRLASAASVEEIVGVVLDYAGPRVPRCIFFVVKGDAAVGWTGRGAGLEEARLRSLSVRVGGDPREGVLSLVSPGAAHYLGPLPQAPRAHQLYRDLGVPAPRIVLIVPIAVKGRAAAYLYGDSGETPRLAVDVPAILGLCGRAGMALQIIILRNKILGP